MQFKFFFSLFSDTGNSFVMMVELDVCWRHLAERRFCTLNLVFIWTGLICCTVARGGRVSVIMWFFMGYFCVEIVSEVSMFIQVIQVVLGKFHRVANLSAVQKTSNNLAICKNTIILLLEFHCGRNLGIRIVIEYNDMFFGNTPKMSFKLPTCSSE